MNNDYNEEKIELPTLKDNDSEKIESVQNIQTNEKPIFNDESQSLILNNEQKPMITSPIEFPNAVEQSNLNEVPLYNSQEINHENVEMNNTVETSVLSVDEKPIVSTFGEQATALSMDAEKDKIPMVNSAQQDAVHDNKSVLENNSKNEQPFSKKSQIIGTAIVLVIVGLIIYLVANSFLRL